jgi:tRNA nucleotidyltransferase/poly(A) polymerase
MDVFVDEIAGIARAAGIDIYLVGGAVRDLVLGRGSSDLDFLVAGDPLFFARQAADRLKGSFILLDEENSVARVAVKRDSLLYTFDFTGLAGGQVEENLLKRDFTINAMALPVTAGLKGGRAAAGEIIDPAGGLQDLKVKAVKMVYPGAFCDDPLRMLRALRLKAELGMALDDGTGAAIGKEAALIKEVSPERVRDEFFRILKVDRAYDTVKEMDGLGLLREIIPFRDEMAATEQNGYHTDNVWDHCLNALRELEKLDMYELGGDFAGELQGLLAEELTPGRSRWQLIKFCVLIHDSGKPETRGLSKSGRTTFYGHERAGARRAGELARRLALSNKETIFVRDMVLHHMRPLQLSKVPGDTGAAVRRFFRKTGGEGVSLLVHALADQLSDRGPLKKEADLERFGEMVRRLLRQYWQEEGLRIYRPVLTGRDLIRELHLKPGPELGRVLSRLEAEHLVRGAMTRAEALDYCRGLLKKKPSPD